MRGTRFHLNRVPNQHRVRTIGAGRPFNPGEHIRKFGLQRGGENSTLASLHGQALEHDALDVQVNFARRIHAGWGWGVGALACPLGWTAGQWKSAALMGRWSF